MNKKFTFKIAAARIKLELNWNAWAYKETVHLSWKKSGLHSYMSSVRSAW